MTTNDDLAQLWQTEGTATVDVMAPFRVNTLVAQARSRRRWRWWPVVLNGAVLALVTVTHLAMLDTVLPARLHVLVYAGDVLFVAAVTAMLIAVVAQHLQTAALAIADPFDDVGARRFAPLLTTLQRWQWGTAALLVLVAHWAVLSLLLEFVTTNAALEGLVSPALVAAAVAVGLTASWVRLERLAAPLRRVAPPSTQPSLALVPTVPVPANRTSFATATAPARSSTHSSLVPIATEPAAPTPGSSAALMSSRHFRATSTSLLSDRERRSWRLVVGLMALGVVPLLIDALAVLGLQWGPQPSTSGLAPEVYALHRLLPYLPIGVALAASLLTPLALLLGRDVVDRRFGGRFTWLVVLPLLGVPAAFSALGLMVRGDMNAHLWSYSFSLQTITTFVGDRCDDDCEVFSVVTCLATVGRVMRFGAVVVLAAGLRRLVGPGRLRATIFALLAGQVTAWVLTATLPTPDAWRGLVDVVVAVGLVLVAVLSQPAFEEQR